MGFARLVMAAGWLCAFAACVGAESPPRGALSDDDGHEVEEAAADAGAGADAAGPSDADGGGARARHDSGQATAGSDAEVADDLCTSTCAADDCGKIADGCGDFMDCGDCDSGQVCGALTPNKCDTPPPTPCTPGTAETLCSGKCGAVSDTCSDVIFCAADNGGVSCEVDQFCINSTCEDVVATCVAATCEDKQHQCGLDGDGCGGSIDCGTCDAGQVCTYDPDGSRCITEEVIVCTPMLATEACLDTCGIVDDGCGGQIRCEDDPATACPAGTTCGGGGVPEICGAGETCVPLDLGATCAGKCGSQSDGCDGVYACDNTNGGQTCDTANGETCGGGGIASQCGKPACIPKTFAELCPDGTTGKSCGVHNDGCGNEVDCGACPEDESCGLYEPSICAAPPACVPLAATELCAGKCGSVQEPNCGGLYTCTAENGGVACTGQEYCGANGEANLCGAPPQSCVPQTCAELGHTCGFASDGCGHVINCWPGCEGSTDCTGSCDSSSSCLADTTTSAQSCVSGAPTCSGTLCDSLPSGCAGGVPTALTGTVLTPGRLESGTYVNQLAVPNAVIYIPGDPNVALPSISGGVTSGEPASCGRCEDEQLVADGQTVLAAAVTDYKGKFTLQGRVPIGTAFKLVVKVGKWRRVVQVPSGISQSCQSAELPLEYTRLAASTLDGLGGTHLPKVAVSTGNVDAMECVLRSLGIADSEFTLPTGSGRIHMYWANGAAMPGTACTGTYSWRNTSCAEDDNFGCRNLESGCSWSNPDTQLYATQDALNAYDMVVFDCEGLGHYDRSPNNKTRLLNYVDAGGRVFASHWSYQWLDNNGPLENASAWTNTGWDDSAIGYVSLPSGDTARSGANAVKSLLYRDWLDWHGALTGSLNGQLDLIDPPSLALTDPRDVAGESVGAATDEWMYREKNGAKVQQLSFNTPYGAAEDAICGRVAFSAFHVAADGGSTLYTSGFTFPDECHSGPLSPQEKTLAFMLFDLGACVSAGDPPQAPSCEPKTAAELCPEANDACSYLSDTCGGVVDCGACDSGYYCDGNLCRTQECTPLTCSGLGYNCGSWGDGCGGIARDSQGQEGCGECSNGQTCAFSYTGICGGCVQIEQSVACPTNSCGAVSDGCGGVYQCGTCSTGFCGGGGPNQCGTATCTELTQAQACGQKDCGLVADGCGGTLRCGTCVAPDSCGGGGAANVCGHPDCAPKTLQEACSGLSCGWVSDGCGGALNCGTCSDNGICGGAGPNQCGGSCTPTTCAAQGAECGTTADHCGSLLDCGPCPTGQTCGAVAPNECDTGTGCTPRSCAQAGADCGLVGDGCGAALDCGGCTAPETCGGAGIPNQCGTGTGGCNKLTCAEQNTACGAASDGCGGLLDCGGCPSGYYCSNGSCNVALQ